MSNEQLLSQIASAINESNNLMRRIIELSIKQAEEIQQIYKDIMMRYEISRMGDKELIGYQLKQNGN